MDLINRQETIDEVINLWSDKPFGNPTLVEIKECIEALPTAQPTFTDAEIQRMQELDSAQIQKAESSSCIR